MTHPYVSSIIPHDSPLRALHSRNTKYIGLLQRQHAFALAVSLTYNALSHLLP